MKFSDKISLTREEKKKIWPTIIRSWLIGNIIGILPGAGASIACFVGYNTAKQFSKTPQEFGHGAIEGVAGSEAANNAFAEFINDYGLNAKQIHFVNLIKENVIYTSEAMKILNCTRQYINELVKKNVLNPIKSDDKNTLFLKNEVISLKWS